MNDKENELRTQAGQPGVSGTEQGAELLSQANAARADATWTKEQLAALLNGRLYGEEITEQEEAQAKASGLIVVFGASDDLIEFRGVVRDESYAWGGATFLIHRCGVLESFERFRDENDQESEYLKYFEARKTAVAVTAGWDVDGYSWVITSAVPHATFEIIEDDEKYCKGIVLHVDDLPPQAIK